MTTLTLNNNNNNILDNNNKRDSLVYYSLPLLPPTLKRNTTNDLNNECELLQNYYTKTIELIEDNDDGNYGSYGSITNLKEKHYYYSHGQIYDSNISKETMKKIMREVTNTLPSLIDINTRGSMFIRYDDVSPQYLRAILTGVEGTPYSSGIFIFDIYLPPEYPDVPCLVKHVTPRSNEVHANNGPGGFSPNLHSDSGQVCLSLLGTWEGPGWNPKTSNVYQVLSSILWMILGAAHPYYMEPGFGGWEGTAPINIDLCPDREHVIEYDEEVKYHMVRLCILAPLLDPPEGFEKVVHTHLRMKRKLILSTIEKWQKTGKPEFKENMENLKKEVISAYQQIRTIEDIQVDIKETNEIIEFIQKKMLFLKQKIDLAGGEEIAQEKVPKAWQRYCIGPQLILDKQNLLKKYEDELQSRK